MINSNHVLTALLTGSVLLGTAGCTKKINKEALQTTITSAYAPKGVVLKSVDCPAGRELKANDSFDCTGELTEGGKVTITVKQKDDKGNLGFDLQGVYVAQDEISKLMSGPDGKVDVKCPKKVAVLRKGEKYQCDVARGDLKGKADIGVKDDETGYTVKIMYEGKPPEEKQEAQEEPDAPPAAAE
jgi:hypothetical protein